MIDNLIEQCYGGSFNRVEAPMRQLELPERRWGGRREGAGRKAVGRPGVPHRRRAGHVGRQPVHVTMRRRDEVVSLRRREVFGALRGALSRASKDEFRVIHFSVQGDHVHLIVEAEDEVALVRGVQGLAVRTARAVNKVLRRRGPVWGDRHHRRELATPREVRNAIAYVLLNFKKHMPWSRGIDPCSSAPWFDGIAGFVPARDGPVPPPRTWLASVGWRHYGLLRAPT